MTEMSTICHSSLLVLCSSFPWKIIPSSVKVSLLLRLEHIIICQHRHLESGFLSLTLAALITSETFSVDQDYCSRFWYLSLIIFNSPRKCSIASQEENENENEVRNP